MRAVLDTNFWVSALVYSRESSPVYQILERFLDGDFVLVTSPALLDEFCELCKRHNVEKAVIEEYAALMQHTQTDAPPYVELAEPSHQLTVISSDPADNRVLECAIEGHADVIVSGDKHLLTLKRYQGIPILSPREFIAQLTKDE